MEFPISSLIYITSSFPMYVCYENLHDILKMHLYIPQRIQQITVLCCTVAELQNVWCTPHNMGTKEDLE